MSQVPSPRPQRSTRAEKKAATRERLLVAAERIATREGFARVSLDRVAEEAGLTKGAIYSNFASKDELLLEVIARLTPGLNLTDEVTTAGTLREVLERGADALVRASRTRRKEVMLASEFDTLAMRDSKLKRALLASQSWDEGAEVDPIAGWLGAHAEEFPLPPEQYFEAVNAVAWGLVLRRLLHGPERVSDELIRWTLTRLLPWDGDSSD